MEKMPRYVEIDYSKYAPDLPVEQREAYYGLPKHVQLCTECVMSNQKPNSCYEFEHTIKSIKKTMVIQEDGVCDACHACHNKADGHIDWALREKELRELCDEYRKNDGSYDHAIPNRVNLTSSISYAPNDSHRITLNMYNLLDRHNNCINENENYDLPFNWTLTYKYSF